MFRRITQIFCLLLMVLGPITAFSQAKLHVNSVVSNPVDTVYWNNDSAVVEYTVVVENIGNNQLTSACDLRFRYNQWQTDYVKKTWQATNFEVGQSVIITIRDTIFDLSSNRYKGGDNIIVIWPHSDSPTQVPDTASHDIYVTNLTGIRDPKVVAARVDIFPNPASSLVNIQYADSRTQVECVRVLGVDGKVYQHHDGATRMLDISGLSSGLYFIEFKFKDGILGAMRLAKP